jgi:hypothetical protein
MLACSVILRNYYGSNYVSKILGHPGRCDFIVAVLRTSPTLFSKSPKIVNYGVKRWSKFYRVSTRVCRLFCRLEPWSVLRKGGKYTIRAFTRLKKTIHLLVARTFERDRAWVAKG